MEKITSKNISKHISPIILVAFFLVMLVALDKSLLTYNFSSVFKKSLFSSTLKISQKSNGSFDISLSEHVSNKRLTPSLNFSNYNNLGQYPDLQIGLK